MRIGLVLLCISAFPLFGLAAGKSSLLTNLSLSSKVKKEKSYQADTKKRSIFAKYIAHRNVKNTNPVFLNPKGSNRADSGFIGNIAIGSVDDDINIGVDSPIIFPPEMFITTCSFSGSGLADMTIVDDQCSGSNNNHCKIQVEVSPSSTGTKSVTKTCPWVFDPPPNGEDPDPPLVYGSFVDTISWNGVKVVPPPRCPMKQNGSIIRVDNRSLSEIIPLVGVNFGLYYSTELADRYVSAYSGIRDYMWRATGFVPTVQHIYDQSRKRLFRGDGSSVDADYVSLTGGKVRVVSGDGSEVYEFDGDAKHLTTKYALTGTTKYTFNYETSDNQLKSIVDAYGNTTTFNKDIDGNLISITAPNGQVSTLTVDLDSYMMTSLTNPNGETYQFEYDVDKVEFLTKLIKPGGQESTFTYDDDGRLVKDLGAGGNYTQLSGDLIADPMEVIKQTALGIATIHEVEQDVSGNYIRSSTEPSGLETQYTEAPNGGMTMSSPSVSTTETRTNDVRLGSLYQRLASRSLTYGLTGGSTAGLTTNVSQTISPATPTNIFTFTSLTTNSNHGGLVTSEVYTTSNKTFTTTTPQGVVSTRTINAKEQTTATKLGSDTAWSFAYDTKGRLSESKQSTKNKNTYAYDTAGFLQSITNPWLGVTSFAYDLAGRRTSTTLPDTRVIYYAYDANGNLTGVTPPGRPQHQFLMNLFELVEKYLPPSLSGLLTKDTQYSYNLDKQVTNIARPDGESVAYNYSATTGLKTNMVQSLAGTDAYAYDTEGRILQIDSADGIRTTLTYDGPFLKKEKQTLISDSSQLGYVEYALDSRFRIGTRDVVVRSEPTYQTNYSYNNDDQKTVDKSISYTYNATSGRLATSTLGNVTDSWTYDTYGFVTGYTAKYSGTTIYSYSLTRDTGSRISGKSETIGGVTTAYVYTYDSAGRLKTVTKGGVAYSSYNYDSNSNRISGVTAGNAFTATYDDQDRILTYNANTYSYNANGEMVSKQVGSATPTSYEYNQLGNLKKVTLPSSSMISYSLDGYQRRAIRQVDALPRDFYTHEGSLKVVGSLTEGSSTSLKTFIFGADGNSPEYIRYQGADLRVIKDHLGSVRLVVNASTGTIVQRIDYNDIGGVVSDTNPGFQPYGFAGGMYDYQTGLVKFGAREYDAESGRWTSKDPIGFGGGDTNLYGYVANDPINWTDPTGLARGDWWDPRTYAYPVVEAGQGATDFARNYSNMRQANTIGADKYFHCMANCQSSQRGPGGQSAAVGISDGRELFDQYIKGDSANACNADRAANAQGQSGAGGGACSQVCGSLRPGGLGPQW